MNAALNGKRYGKIIFAKGDFTDLSGFGDKSVDCIVSLSALEHSDHEGIIRAVSQFDRILKDDGSMFLTISATDGEDWFFKPCRGWCFSEDTIRKIFGLDNSPSNYADYQKLFARLKASSEIRKRVDRFYYESGDNGLPWGIYDPKYQPVGIVKTKTRR